MAWGKHKQLVRKTFGCREQKQKDWEDGLKLQLNGVFKDNSSLSNMGVIVVLAIFPIIYD